MARRLSLLPIRLRPAGVVPALILIGALLGVACSKRITKVDPERFPEGTPSTSLLVSYPDAPTLVKTYRDLGDFGPSPEDILLETDARYVSGPGAVVGTIFDFTPATTYQIFRKTADGGFAPLKDFLLHPRKLLLDAQTDLLVFADPNPTANDRQYVGRGVIDGLPTKDSPLTNVARVGATPVADDMAVRFYDYSGLFIPPGATRVPDSTFIMEWDPYPGATGYWVHIYQLTAQTGQGIVASGIPSPIYIGTSRDFFVGLLPASRTSFRVVNPIPSDVKVLLNRTMINNQTYTVRVSVVGTNGQLLSYTGANGTQERFRTDSTYTTFPLGGYRWVTSGPPIIVGQP